MEASKLKNFFSMTIQECREELQAADWDVQEVGDAEPGPRAWKVTAKREGTRLVSTADNRVSAWSRLVNVAREVGPA